MKVVVILFMIWSYGYAKNVLGSEDLLKILPGQDITAGGDLECVKAAPEKATARLGGPDACPVKPHSKPWIVALWNPCGGTLISKSVVLTAAHCICESIAPSITQPAGKCFAWKDKYVTLGEHDIFGQDGEQIIKIKHAVAHKNWTGNYEEAYDVALIFLEEDAILSKDVQIASLPQNDEKCPLGNVLTLAGWGKDPQSFENHFTLWAVKQECLDINKCSRFNHLRNDGPILCIGDKNDPRNSAFYGDSGGPLTYTDNYGKTTIFGIVSGNGAKEGEMAGKSATAFSRVSYPGVLDWIKSTMESAAANNN